MSFSAQALHSLADRNVAAIEFRRYVVCCRNESAWQISVVQDPALNGLSAAWGYNKAPGMYRVS